MHEQEFEACKKACEKRGYSFTEMLGFSRILPHLYFCEWKRDGKRKKIKMFRTKNQCIKFAKEHNGIVI